MGSNGDLSAGEIEECAFAYRGAGVNAEQVIWSHKPFFPGL